MTHKTDTVSSKYRFELAYKEAEKKSLKQKDVLPSVQTL
ncbi:hypothetical protein SMIDD26_01041 [Streptococcus mitis]|uniref:Uncharacterized protein n=1 Tax=Streptococcus mitis TaxID=28037 RepID=A0A139PS33_STRMT|nr:hypothetical protein SMIDD26_01041 [Streptococcus mitis]